MKKRIDKKIKEEVKKDFLFQFMHYFHYPKITLLIFFILIAYIFFKNPIIYQYLSHLNNWSYIGVFLAGMLFAFGFTAPFAIGFFIVLNPENIIFAGILGGFGAFVSNLIIFKFIRFSFMDEFKRLKHNRILKEITNLIENNLGHRVRVYLMYIFAGFIIASPFPDEIGVIMLAGIKHINIWIFSIITFILSTLGIIFILMI